MTTLTKAQHLLLAEAILSAIREYRGADRLSYEALYPIIANADTINLSTEADMAEVVVRAVKASGPDLCRNCRQPYVVGDSGAKHFSVFCSEECEQEHEEIKVDWVNGGMEGECPWCGEASGCHTDDGGCDAPSTAITLERADAELCLRVLQSVAAHGADRAIDILWTALDTD